ncbi:XRE family transcriptional regulator [Actinoplanes sp. RD1]|uniref:XRE family transcriptional regulator n=1 Tax=Actinoplanes sp. RD1 TaxID=3064538 RepID=UPI0027408EC6|nr:XRE family transcriptional regulator [Actinoplanes sp. RD1]
MTDAYDTDSPAAQLRDLFREIKARAFAADKSLTLRKVADRAGMTSAGHLSNVLNGKRTPTPATAEAFARAMGATGHEVERIVRLAERAQAVAEETPGPARVPHLLKPAPPGFVGRSEDLSVLSALAGLLHRGAPKPSVTRVSGLGGVGKTWFVLHWAHLHLAKFPGGQLYADLRGFTDNAEPAGPGEVLPRFLRALGVAPGAVPEDVDDQVLLYQDVTRGRRLLVVLDNVAEVAQIEQLLPDGPSAVVVTSRNHLTDLLVGHTAGAMQLGALTDAESRKLLVAGPVAARAAAEPDSLAELLAICAGLPLALSIVRAQAVIQAKWPLSEVVAYYRDAPSPVDVMSNSGESADLRHIFWSEFNRFSSGVRSAFLALGLCPGVEVDLAGAASLLSRPAVETAELLQALVRKSLLEQPARDRFRMHDLLWSFAARRAVEELSPVEQAAGRRRLAASLLAGAHAGQLQLSPHRPAITLDGPSAGVIAQRPDGDAMDWFDTRYATLTALQEYADAQRWDAEVWQLAWSLDDYHYRRGMVNAHERAWRRGLAAATRSGEPHAAALARLCLGNILARSGRTEEALALLRAALDFFEQAGDVANLAQTHRALHLGTPDDDSTAKLHHAQHSLHLFRELGDPVWIAVALNALGETHALAGEPGAARGHSLEALRLHSDLDNEPGQAAALDSLGIAAAAAGDPAEAEERYRAAVALYRRLRNVSSEVNTLIRLGEVLADLPGRAEDARTEWTRAAVLLGQQGRDAEADEVRRRIAAL